MGIVVEITNDFLSDIYVNDFDDNYHRLASEPSSELEKEARQIRRRYKRLNEYFKALAIYNEYMNMMTIKYGGPKLFKIKLKGEVINDFIPPKPRMKNNSFNKFLIKNKIVLSNTNFMNIDEDNIENYVNNFSNEEIGEFEPVPSFDKVAEKISKEEIGSLSAERIKNLTSLDYLEEYFKNKNKKKNDDDSEKQQVFSLKEIMSGKYINKIKDTSDKDEVILYRGQYLTRESVEELGFYQNLNDLGWNSIKVMKERNVGKKVSRFIKNKSKKDKKKNKKGKKKDDFLVKIATDNDYNNFKDFEEDMLEFTARNIFK
jgi:hypothetical protein